MTEEETLRFLDSLPLERRLQIMQKMLSDMEHRIARARSELDGVTAVLDSAIHGRKAEQLILPGMENIPQGLAKVDQDRPLSILNSENDKDEWKDFSLPDSTGGQAHHVHRLRLMDAAEQYDRLLKRYGYVKRHPAMTELAHRQRAKDASLGGQNKTPDWSTWVAKDQNTLDRPKSQDWSNWVVLGDDDAEW